MKGVGQYAQHIPTVDKRLRGLVQKQIFNQTTGKR